MVTTSFGNRNFIQPVGRLSMHSKCLDFFSFNLWVGGGSGGFLSFFLCSQHVPFKFPMDSHQVLNVFLMFPMCSSRVFPIAPWFNPIYFAESPLLLTYIHGPKGEAIYCSMESSILGSLHSFNFFVMGQSNFCCEKKLDLWGTPN
jgi:hypothetical protein